MEEAVAVPIELIEDIHYNLHMYNTARDRANAGHYLIELFNKVSDLSSWHPGCDNNGTMPWQRED